MYSYSYYYLKQASFRLGIYCLIHEYSSYKALCCKQYLYRLNGDVVCLTRVINCNLFCSRAGKSLCLKTSFLVFRSFRFSSGFLGFMRYTGHKKTIRPKKMAYTEITSCTAMLNVKKY